MAKLSTRSAGCGGCKEAAALEWEAVTDEAHCCEAVAKLTVAKLSTKSAGCGGCKEAPALEWEAATDAHCCAVVATLNVAKLSTRSAGWRLSGKLRPMHTDATL